MNTPNYDYLWTVTKQANGSLKLMAQVFPKADKALLAEFASVYRWSSKKATAEALRGKTLNEVLAIYRTCNKGPVKTFGPSTMPKRMEGAHAL
jgi:hypothetical protein